MSYNDAFINGLESGLSKKAAPADQLARELLEGGLSTARSAGRSGNGVWARLTDWASSPFVRAYRGVKDAYHGMGTLSDDLVTQAKGVLGSEGKGLRGEIETARQNILNEANKRVATNAAVGGGVGGVAGAAAADEGEGGQGFLRGAALGSLGGAALGGRQASKIRKGLANELEHAGLGRNPNAGRMGDFFGLGDLATVRGGVRYNPTKDAVRNRVQAATDLNRALGSMAEDVSSQAFSPLGAAATGAGAGIAGTVGYNVGERYMNRYLGGNNQGNQQGGAPPMPMRPPPMAPPPMPMRPMMPPPPPQAMYGYYPYGGR